MKIINVLVCCVALVFCSCNDWLDVKPRTEKEKEDFYSSESGFRGALTGCYMKLKNRSIYGEQLTMTYIELPAQSWAATGQVQQALSNFEWESVYTENVVKGWYSTLYNVIAQANDLLDYLQKNGGVISNENQRKMIEGEALAIRAFCHFDILRLFGQVPTTEATIKRNLPYAEQSGEKRVKSYDFDTYIGKVLGDYEKAAALLKESDPVLKYSFGELNDLTTSINEGYIKDEFEAYRRIRFNYWGVKALQARAYLYAGDKTNAYTCAMEVIDATLPDGEKVMEFSLLHDNSDGYYILPNEVLIGLNIQTMGDYIPSLFTSETGSIYYKFTEQWHLVSLFFNGCPADHRFKLWLNIPNTFGGRYTVKKYWQSSTMNGEASNTFETERQLVPLIRLPEVYLIAVESAPDADEAARLFEEFKVSRNRIYADDMVNNSLEEEVLNEYRREFVAEGQLFFTYKRLGQRGMWDVTPTGQVVQREVKEENYLIPIPRTEIEY